MLAGTAFAVGSIIACAAGLVLHETMGGGEGSIWWRVLLVVCMVPGLIALPWMFFSLPESVHWLMVNNRHEEAHALLRELAATNQTPIVMDGQITTRPYKQALNEEHSLDWRRFTEMWSVEVRGTSFYLIATFSACGFMYYGFSFIYPHILEEQYGLCASVRVACGRAHRLVKPETQSQKPETRNAKP
jgi:MFS family permease